MHDKPTAFDKILQYKNALCQNKMVYGRLRICAAYTLISPRRLVVISFLMVSFG